MAWLDHFTHTIGSEEIVHVVHQRRCAVLSCWGAPTQTKKSLFLLLLLLFFQKKNIKFKVALRPRPGPEADGHFGFKPWSPSREIRHAELDVTPDMVTSADSSGVHET